MLIGVTTAELMLNDASVHSCDKVTVKGSVSPELPKTFVTSRENYSTSVLDVRVLEIV
jgi:hypothetical protein